MFIHLLLIAESLLSFSFDLDKTQPKQENAIFSPLSIGTTLGMVAIGAKDKTLQEITKALHYKGTQEELADAFNDLIGSIMSHENGYPNLNLNLETVLWMQKNFQFLPQFQSDVVKDFFGDLRVVDFQNPQEAVREMNEWFYKKTSGNLGPLFSEKEITNATRLVIASTLYLKAYFEKAFENTHTRSKSFKVQEGKETAIQMMYQKNTFNYFKGENYQVVELNYLPIEKQFSLWIILPDQLAVPQLKEGDFDKIQQGFKQEWIELSLPRFRLESSLNLIPVLQSLGVQKAFTPSANFSLISEGNDLMISEFKHKAMIVVEEGGTLAEAATSATFIMKALPPPEKTIQFNADHPFAFMIVDKKNKIPLFMGQVIEPKLVMNHNFDLNFTKFLVYLFHYYENDPFCC